MKAADRKAYQAVRERASEKHDYYCCEKCDSSLGVEIHHIKKRSQGGKTEPSNLIALCKYHHDKIHGIRSF